MKIDALVRQNWTANGTNGVLRATPDRAAAVTVRLAPGEPIVSSGEYFAADGNNWRFAEYPVGSRSVVWFLRYGPGLAADHDFIAGTLESANCSEAIAADRATARIVWD